LIRAHENTFVLIRELKRAIAKHGEIVVLTYEDEHGRRFTALEVGRNPHWIDDLPTLDPHERDTIRKIYDRTTRDIQVVVREEGKTPDLILDGVMTELKADFGDLSLDRLVGKAERQIFEFNRRHMITEGEVAVDLRRYDEVPVDDVMAMINRWAATRRHISLDRIRVYARDDEAVFRQQADGTFALEGEEPGRDPGGHARDVDPQMLRVLAAEGRLNEAMRGLTRLERANDEESRRIRDEILARRMLFRLLKFAGLPRPGVAARRAAEKRDLERARFEWKAFKRRHSKSVIGMIEQEAKIALQLGDMAERGFVEPEQLEEWREFYLKEGM
jgi:hypothetical protein